MRGPSFPSVAAWEAFHDGDTCQGLKAIRRGGNSPRLVSVEGHWKFGAKTEAWATR